MMSCKSFRDMRLVAVFCCLLVLLTACGSPSPSGTGGGQTPEIPEGGTRVPTVTTSTRTTATPASTSTVTTQTRCPPAGTARAAVFAPLIAGSHQNIVYIFNQGTSLSSYTGAIKRYDATTGNKMIIVNAPTSQIYDAQISADGQWILFATSVSSTEVALQLVRMDGQGLQTLYCSPGVGNIEWSPDQKTVVFSDGGEVDLLDLATGHLQVVLGTPTVTIGSFLVASVTWLDETHIYIASFVNGYDQPQGSLYALDTAKGAHQQVSDLIKVFDYSGFCLSFDSSVDNAKLFVSTCNSMYIDDSGHTQQGPSTIIAEPALGGPQTTVYTTPTLAITTVRVISRTTLLLLIQNLTGDTSHNGLWKMNLDGTSLSRLTTAGAGQVSSLNGTSQFPWSNISRDGSRYALEISSNNDTTESLLIGSLGGTSPSTFAAVSGLTYTREGVFIVGWTTM